MASIISAGTTSGTSLNLSGDTSGVLQLATNGSTTAITVDTSQNVGIGTTSPLVRLDVRSASVPITSGGGNFAVYSTDSQGINLGGTIVLGGNADTQIAFGVIAGRKENSTSNNRDGYLQFGTFQNGVGVTERARISSVGTLMVNTTTETGASAAVKILANSSASNTALQVNTGTSGGAVFSNKTGNGFQIYGYTGAIGSESYNKVMENGGVGTSIAIGGSSSVSGVGITFPATQVASSNANTLDDYEEGTWTPVYQQSSSNPTVTYSTQKGYYTKVGRLVTINCRLTVNTTSSGSGQVRIGGLPFTMLSTTELGFIPMQAQNNTGVSNRYLSVYGEESQTYLGVYNNDPTSSFAGLGSIQNGFDLIFTYSYFTS